MTDTLMGVSPLEPAAAGDTEDRELSPAELAAVKDLVGRPARCWIRSRSCCSLSYMVAVTRPVATHGSRSTIVRLGTPAA